MAILASTVPMTEAMASTHSAMIRRLSVKSRNCRTGPGLVATPAESAGLPLRARTKQKVVKSFRVEPTMRW